MNEDGKKLDKPESVKEVAFVNKFEEVVEDLSVDVELEANKTILGSTLDKHNFRFVLELFDTDVDLSGIIDSEIPQVVEVDKDGKINFDKITFAKPGEYLFRIKEQIPATPEEYVTYDKSEYKVVVEVELNDKDKTLETTTKIYKVVDANGVKLDKPESVKTVDFENKYEYENIKFTLRKVDEDTEKLLPGAVFDLYLADESGNPSGEPIVEGLTTSDDGVVEVNSEDIDSEHVKYDTLYVLVETKAPTGYLKGDNTVFYIKGEDGLFPEISDKVVIGNEDTITITNKSYGFILPETGGIGTMQYVLMGSALTTISALGYFSTRSKKNKK